MPHLALSIASLALGLVLSISSASAERARGSYVWRDSPPQAADEHVPRLLFLNRCKGGCVLSPGPEDAINNTSTIVGSTSTLAEFPFGDELWNEVLECVRAQYFPFNINVTDIDPGELPHFESIVAGDAADVGATGAAGIAPFSCGVFGNSINFSFAETIGADAQQLCEVIAQESGHVMGMEHAFLCEDPMTYLTGCGAKSFQDIDAPCGEFSEAPCECGNETQNSVQHLLGIFGPGQQKATADLAIVEVKEDPATSDGNGVAQPGERLLIDVLVSNLGNLSTEALLLKLSAGGHLKLVDPPELVVEGGKSASVQLVADVESSACGEEVSFTVTSKLGDESWTADSVLRAGLGPIAFTESLAEGDGSWLVADEEAPAQGAWEYGVPAATFFAGRTVQSNGASAGPGSSAWITGLGGAWDESVVVGKSELVSTTIDVNPWQSITGIQYNLWYMAFDRSSPSLEPSPDAHLIVELSRDGGKKWKEIDAVSGAFYRWETREASFPTIAPSSKVKLRFTVDNPGGVDDRLIEVGIDSVTLVGDELLCTPTGGCGCAAGNSSSRDAWLWCFVPAFLWWRRRATRRAPVNAPACTLAGAGVDGRR